MIQPKPSHMIRNTNIVQYRNLGIGITDSPQHTKFKQPQQKPHHRIKRAFHITLPWFVNHIDKPNSSPRVRPLPGNLDRQRSSSIQTRPYRMIRNTKCVHPHNLKGIEITDSTQDTKFKQTPQKSTRHPKCHHHIKRAFDITLLWCHHIEQQNSLPDLNNEATSYVYIQTQKGKKLHQQDSNGSLLESSLLNLEQISRVQSNAMQPNTWMDKH